MGAYRWNIYIICGLLMALEGYDAYVVANLAAVIAKGLSVPIPSMGFVFIAQSAGMALGFYTIPMLADRIGRRGIILLGSTLFGLLTLASTMATTLEQFTIVRFLAFLSFGATLPNVAALVAEYVPSSRRGRLITWLFIAHGLGASVAGFLGPAFVAHHSWQAALWAGGGAMLLLVAYLCFRLPESIRFLITRNPQDPGIGRILQRIDRTLTLPADATFTTTEVKSSGIPLVGLFRDGRTAMTLLLWIAMGGAVCVTATLTAWLPSYLHVLGGLDVATGTHMSAISAIGAIAGPILLTMLMKRWGMPLSLMATLFVAFVAMSMFALVAYYPRLGWVLGICFGLLVIGAQAGLNSLVASSYPTSMRSTGIGWAGGVGRITSIIGPGVGGAMLAAHWEAWKIYGAIASPLLVAAIAMLVFARLKTPDASAASDAPEGLAPVAAK